MTRKAQNRNLGIPLEQISKRTDLKRDWLPHAWPAEPRTTMFAAGPDSVLLGFENFDTGERFAFALSNEKARKLGYSLLHHLGDGQTGGY